LQPLYIFLTLFFALVLMEPLVNFRISITVLAVGLLLSAFPGCLSSSTAKPVVTAALTVTPTAVRSGVWILIDSKQEKLMVYRNQNLEVVFDNIAFGAAGVGRKLRRGDDVTPKGVFQVGWITKKSKFVHFIGLNYPSLEDAQYALSKGTINHRTYERIALAHNQKTIPPQDTVLGGMIGIHGVGQGSLEIHRLANWTAGCIALENGQIRRLAHLVQNGTIVEIR
jgi:murein L,D-transpeptidase YafK